MPRTTRCGAYGESPVVPKLLSSVVYRSYGPPVIEFVTIEFGVQMQNIKPPLNVGQLHIGSDLVQCLHSSWPTPTLAVLVPAQTHLYGSTGQFELYSDSGYLSVDGVAPVDQFIPFTLGG